MVSCSETRPVIVKSQLHPLHTGARAALRPHHGQVRFGMLSRATIGGFVTANGDTAPPTGIVQSGTGMHPRCRKGSPQSLQGTMPGAQS